jgi:hypothetical protein
MIEIRDDVRVLGIGARREGTGMLAMVRFVDVGLALVIAYERAMPPEEYGVWAFELLGVTGDEEKVRLRMEDGALTGIGHRSEEIWFDPRAYHEVAYSQRQASLVEKALRHINLNRAGYGHRELDRSDWSDEDVFIHAKSLGWSEKT